VIDALNQGNMQATSDEKGKVEQGQRAMRKRQGLGEKEWHATFFKNVDGDEVFEQLAEPIGAELGKEKTVGVWKFDHERARVVRKPYRGDLTPTA
jgi:hypothetical protein